MPDNNNSLVNPNHFVFQAQWGVEAQVTMIVDQARHQCSTAAVDDGHRMRGLASVCHPWIETNAGLEEQGNII